MNPDRLPRPPAPPVSPAAFVLFPVFCPPPFAPAPWVEALYRWAFEQGRAVARPSLPERDLLGVWN